ARATRPELLPDRILDAAIELAGAERGFLIQRTVASAVAARPAEPAPAPGAAEARGAADSPVADEAPAAAGAPRTSAEAPSESAPLPEWEVIAARNIDRENVRKALQKVSRSITAGVLASGKAFRSDDAINDEALAPAASVSELKLRSVLCVAMRVGDE